MLKQGDLLEGKFRVMASIGSGGYSSVYLSCDILTGAHYALKVFTKDARICTAFPIELRCLNTLAQIDPKLQHFCRLIDFVMHPRSTGPFFVLEPLGKSLYQLYRKRLPHHFSPEEIAPIARQLIQAVDLMHQNGIIHTDLKLENILEDPASPGHFKLIDFGTAVTTIHPHTHLCSTVYYRAPEVLLGLPWTYKVDIWSIGCILTELSLGSIPFYSSDTSTHLRLIHEYTAKPPSSSTPISSFIFSILRSEPSHRPSASSLLHHPFLYNTS